MLVLSPGFSKNAKRASVQLSKVVDITMRVYATLLLKSMSSNAGK